MRESTHHPKVIFFCFFNPTVDHVHVERVGKCHHLPTLWGSFVPHWMFNFSVSLPVLLILLYSKKAYQEQKGHCSRSHLQGDDLTCRLTLNIYIYILQRSRYVQKIVTLPSRMKLSPHPQQHAKWFIPIFSLSPKIRTDISSKFTKPPRKPTKNCYDRVHYPLVKGERQ